MKRINIVGSSASGKTTFGRELAKALDIDFIEMDAIYWGKNWTEPTDEVFFQRLHNALQGDAWVLDGNYTRTLHIKWKNVDTVIWLDYGFIRTFMRSIRRALIRSITRKEIWPGTGNRESLYMSFLSKDSVVLWMLKQYGKTRVTYRQYMQSPEFEYVRFLRLSSPRDAESFINEVRLKGFLDKL